MKTLKSTTVFALFATVALFAVSCGGGNSKKQTAETASETKTETRAESSKTAKGEWPSNEFTKQVPKPDISVRKAEDGPNGFNVDFEYESATLENLKAYVAKLKAAGFDERVSEDIDGERYVVTLFNAAGWRVTVSNSSGRFMIISKPEQV